MTPIELRHELVATAHDLSVRMAETAVHSLFLAALSTRALRELTPADFAMIGAQLRGTVVLQGPLASALASADTTAAYLAAAQKALGVPR